MLSLYTKASELIYTVGLKGLKQCTSNSQLFFWIVELGVTS